MTVKAAHKIVLRARRSRFVEIFRTTPPKTVCPNFFVLAHANGCAFAPHCSYCYLKSSFHRHRGQHAFVNIDAMEREVSRWIKTDNLESYVLNSGNLADSLSFEQKRPLIVRLIEQFRREAEAHDRPHTLLLVTKGGMDDCRPLLDRPPCRNIVISFSVNNVAAARKHESGAAPVPSRMMAARQLMRKGWRVRIRIDPMILGYDYSTIIERVRTLHPERVTLGTLRSESSLKNFIDPKLLAPLEPAKEPGGMARYPRTVRLTMYRQAVRRLKSVCPVGLCEETLDVWQALGLKWQDKPCNCGG